MKTKQSMDKPNSPLSISTSPLNKINFEKMSSSCPNSTIDCSSSGESDEMSITKGPWTSEVPKREPKSMNMNSFLTTFLLGGR